MRGWGDKKWLWSEKKISVSSGSLCPSAMMSHPHLPKDGEEAVTAWGEGREGRRVGWWGDLPLSTHDSKTRGEWGWARGWEKTTQTNILKTFCQAHQN